MTVSEPSYIIVRPDVRGPQSPGGWEAACERFPNRPAIEGFCDSDLLNASPQLPLLRIGTQCTSFRRKREPRTADLAEQVRNLVERLDPVVQVRLHEL